MKKNNIFLKKYLSGRLQIAFPLKIAFFNLNEGGYGKC